MNKFSLRSTLAQHANLVGQYSHESITDEDFGCAIRLIKKELTKEISRWGLEDQVVIQSKWEAVCALQSSKMQTLRMDQCKSLVQLARLEYRRIREAGISWRDSPC
jgi:hypothetical protein